MAILINGILLFYLFACYFGMLSGIHAKNRTEYYAYLLKWYEHYARSPTTVMVGLAFRAALVVGVQTWCGKVAGALMVVWYCLEAAMMITLGQRKYGKPAR